MEYEETNKKITLSFKDRMNRYTKKIQHYYELRSALKKAYKNALANAFKRSLKVKL